MPAQPAPRHNRATELAQIELFLSETGATVCPPAYAWGIRAARSLVEEAQLLLAFRPTLSAVAEKAITDAHWRRLARRLLYDAFRQGAV